MVVSRFNSYKWTSDRKITPRAQNLFKCGNPTGGVWKTGGCGYKTSGKCLNCSGGSLGWRSSRLEKCRCKSSHGLKSGCGGCQKEFYGGCNVPIEKSTGCHNACNVDIEDVGVCSWNNDNSANVLPIQSLVEECDCYRKILILALVVTVFANPIFGIIAIYFACMFCEYPQYTSILLLLLSF